MRTPTIAIAKVQAPEFGLPRVRTQPSHRGEEPDAEAARADCFRICETFNADGGKRAVKKRLGNNMAKVVLIQEVGHLPGDFETLDSWRGTRGWAMRPCVDANPRLQCLCLSGGVRSDRRRTTISSCHLRRASRAPATTR